MARRGVNVSNVRALRRVTQPETHHAHFAEGLSLDVERHDLGVARECG